MPPALAALTTPQIAPLTDEELTAAATQGVASLREQGVLAPLTPTRDPFSQIVVGAVRAPFTAAEQPLRALSAIPGLRGVFEPAAEAVAAIPPAPSGGILESGVESGLSFVLSTFGLTGLPLLSRVFTTVPRVTTGLLAIFGGAEFAETRKELEDINKTLPANQQIPTDEITRTALISGAAEAVLEGIPIPVALRRILPGVAGGRGLTERAAQAVGRAFGAPGGMLRETARRAAEIAAVEIPQEAATAAIQAAARHSVLEPRGVPTPTPAAGALAAIAPTAVASTIIGGVGRLTQRPRAVVASPQGQPAGDVAQAARPDVTPAQTPVLPPPVSPAPGLSQEAAVGTVPSVGVPGAPRRQEAIPLTQAINPLTGEGVAPSVPPTPLPSGAGTVINPLTGEQVQMSPEDAARFAGTPLLGVRPRGEQTPEGTPVGPPSPAEVAAAPAAAIAPLPAAQQSLLPDVVSALRNLGYTRRDATTAAQGALVQQPASLEEAIVLALRPRAEGTSRTTAQPRQQPSAPQERAPAQAPQAQEQHAQPGLVVAPSPDIVRALSPEQLSGLLPQADGWILPTHVSLEGGLPTTLPVYRGEGRPDQGSIYTDPSRGAIVGAGEYYAATADQALAYGPAVQASEVTLGNPLVLHNDVQLHGIPGVPRAVRDNLPAQHQAGAAIRAYAEQQGHDGLIVNIPSAAVADRSASGDDVRTLRSMFDHSQAVVFRQQAVPATPPAPALPAQPLTGQQTLVDTSQLAEQERATQAQITREGVEAEAGTRLRPTIEQAQPTGLFEQEQALPFQEAPQSTQQNPAVVRPQAPTLPRDALALGRALADIYAGPLQRMTEQGQTSQQMHAVVANELRERYGDAELRRSLQIATDAGFAGDDALVRLVDNAIDQAFGLPTEAEAQQQALREAEEGADILATIRRADEAGRFGIKVTKATGIERDFRDLVGLVEGGRRVAARLMNNRSGLTPQEMANRLADLGYLPEASEGALLDHLRERLGTGRHMGPRYQPGGVAEPLAFFSRSVRRPTPGGDRADATPTTKRQATAIPARLQRVADGETIIATTMQAEPGRRVTIPGVRRREGTIEVVRTIPPHPVVAEMRATGSVAFVGQTIRPGQAGTRDIAVIGQLVRDPEVEHLHYVLVDEAGGVVRVIEVSSRLPSSAAPFIKATGQPLGPGFMAKGMRDLQAQMRQAGATGFWMLHNHPSGNPTPSQADVNFTRRMAVVPGFQGHVVIDSGRYATINAAGEQTVASLEAGGPDPFLQPSLGVPFAEIPIQNTADAAAVGRALATPGFVTLVLLTKRPAGPDLGIRGVLLMPEGALTQSHDQIKAYIESLESEFGAVLATAYYDGGNPTVHTAAEMLYRDGVLTDYVMAMPQGGEVSLAEELPGVAPDSRLVQARRLEAAASERVEEETPGLDIPNTIQGVTVAQAGKLATAYRMMFDVGHSLHSSHIQRPLSQVTFQKLRIRWEQMEDIGQEMLLRFMQHPEELDALRRRIQRDPTAGLSTAENAGLVQWSMVMMDDLDVKRSLGEIDQATFDQEWDAIIKNALLIPAAASSAGRTLAMQRRFQQVGSSTITDFLRREERARGRALTDEERRQHVGDFLDILRAGDRDQIRAAMEKQTDPTLLDYYWEAYYGSLLSGLPTLNINTFGTLAHITFQKFVVGPTAVGLDWMISAFSGQERQRYMQEVFADFNATWKNAGQQYRDAWYWWKSPFPQAIGGEGQLTQPTGALRQGLALTRGGMRLDAGSGADAWMRAPTQNADGTPNRWGPVMRRLAPFVGAASRVMAATDAVATNLAFQGEVAKLATREGLRRFGVQDRQQVDNFVAHVQTHLAQFPEIEAAAKAAAQADTFNDPAGPLARALLGVRRAPQPFGFFFRLLAPFANTPDRLLARGAELVPGLGLVVGYREAGLTYTGWLADFKKGDPKAVEVVAKQVIGLMLASMAALLWDKDLLTGPLPTEPQERQAWERQGKLPFAIKMGENWVEYRRVEPFISAPFGALTAGLQAIKTMRENRLKQGLALDYSYMDDASSVAAGIAFNMTRFVLDSSYFSGLANFFASTSRTSQGFATGLTQQLVSATLPLSGLLRNLNRAIEASGMLGTEPGVVLMRQRERVGEQFFRSIPGAATGVRPRLDVFGQPVVSERPLLGAVGGLLSPIRRQVAQEDQVEAAFERLQYRPGRPPRRQLETVVGRRIEDEEYDAYTRRRGELARETIERIVGLPFFGELPQDKQLARLKQAFGQATRRARREVFGRPETTQERRTRFVDATLAAASGE